MSHPSPLRVSPRHVALLALLLVAISFGATDLYNFDLGLARATGRYILEHHTVPTANVFSAVFPDRPFVDDKWLFHVLCHLVVDRAGPAFAVVLRVLLVAWLGYLLLPRRPGDVGADFLVAMLAMLTASERFAFRPELISMLLLALFMRVLGRAELPRGAAIAGLLCLQVIWVNSHGYFVLGPIVAGATALGRLLDGVRAGTGWRGPARALLLVPALIGACFINPYGASLVWSPVEILLDLRGNHAFYSEAIVEFVPAFGYQDVLPSDLIAFRVLLGLAAVAIVFALVQRRVRAVELLPLVLFFIMSLDIRRNVAPFAVVAAPVVARWFGVVLEAMAARRPRLLALLRVGSLGGALVLAAMLATWNLTQRIAVHDRLERSRGFGESRIAHPDAEVDFVLENLPADGMFNSFSFGSYFVGRGYPQRRPFIDGNTAGYDVAFFRRYADLVSGKADIDAAIAEFGLRYFLLKPGHALTAALLQRDDVVPLCLGRHACVLGLKGRVDDAVLARFDLRRALDAGTFIDTTTPASTRWTRWLPTAELNRARLWQALGRTELALAACDAAERVNPELFESHQQRGAILLQAGQFAAAERALDRALALAPRVATSLTLRGIARLARRDPTAARADLTAACALTPDDAATRAWLATAAMRAGDVGEAERQARAALACDERTWQAHLLLGQVQLGAGRPADAIAHLERALASGPSTAERRGIEQLLGEARRAAGR